MNMRRICRTQRVFSILRYFYSFLNVAIGSLPGKFLSGSFVISGWIASSWWHYISSTCWWWPSQCSMAHLMFWNSFKPFFWSLPSALRGPWFQWIKMWRTSYRTSDLYLGLIRNFNQQQLYGNGMRLNMICSLLKQPLLQLIKDGYCDCDSYSKDFKALEHYLQSSEIGWSLVTSLRLVKLPLR